MCYESYYDDCVRHLNVGIGEQQNHSVADHLLFCNHSASYDNFNILRGKNKIFFLENQLIMRYKSSLNWNITSASLHLFDKP